MALDAIRTLGRFYITAALLFIMTLYVDGFVIPIKKRNVAAYRRMAQGAVKLWKKYGVLEFRECVGDDLKVRQGMGLGFKKMAKLKPDETVMFSWVTFKSKKHRDQFNAKIMKDPRVANMMKDKKMPFDMKRMSYGGFRVIVDA